MKARVKEMEEEAAKLREMQAQVEKELDLAPEEVNEADLRSVYVGNVFSTFFILGRLLYCT